MCLPAIGALIGAASSIMGGIAQSNQYKAQAAYNKRQAEIESDASIYQAQRIESKGKRILGQQITGFARAGFNPTVGSAVDVAVDSITENNLDVAAARYGGKIRSSNFLYQAKIDKMNAKSSMIGGILGGVSGLIDAASSLAPQGFGNTGRTNVYGTY